MKNDREKWNKRFASQDSYLGKRPSQFLLKEIELIKGLLSGRKALDIACGEGRNSLFLAEHGFQVTGLDISDVGLIKANEQAEKLKFNIAFNLVDLEQHRLEGSFDLVINFNFLLRKLIPQEISVLKPGGILLFDTILESPTLMASHKPEFFLKHGEIVQIFQKYEGEILYTEEIHIGEMPTARLMFRKSTC